MREIGFRAKSIKTGKWVYGYLVHTGDFPNGNESDKNLRDYWVITNGYTQEEIDPSTIGQYTGLKDKNGKEIYEGDICKTEHGATGIVKWVDGVGYRFDSNEPMWSHPIYGMGGEKEVIGNIYENTELLNNK